MERRISTKMKFKTIKARLFVDARRNGATATDAWQLIVLEPELFDAEKEMWEAEIDYQVLWFMRGGVPNELNETP